MEPFVAPENAAQSDQVVSPVALLGGSEDQFKEGK